MAVEPSDFVLLSPDRPFPYRHLHRSIELRDSGIAGKGIFATSLIREGEVVWDSPPTLAQRGVPGTLSIEEIEQLPADKKAWFLHYAYQVGRDLMNGPTDGGAQQLDEDYSSYYVRVGHLSHPGNHSCDPNTWFTKDTTLIARRDIHPDEEITYDYGSSETYHLKFTECRCGTKACRGTLTGADWKRADFQSTYGDHVVSYIRDMIAEEKSKSKQ